MPSNLELTASEETKKSIDAAIRWKAQQMTLDAIIQIHQEIQAKANAIPHRPKFKSRRRITFRRWS